MDEIEQGRDQGQPRGVPSKRQKTRRETDPRTLQACQICRNKKVKCSGTCPCQYCEKRGLSCNFYGFDNDPVNRQHRQENSSLPHCAPANARGLRNVVATSLNPSTSSSLEKTTPPCQADIFHRPISTASAASRVQHIGASPESVIASVSNLSSSDTFGTELKTVLRSSSTANIPSVLAVNESVSLSNLEDGPTEDEVDDMLAIVILNVGISQQLFDAREILNYISNLYDEPNTPIPNLYFVQILLVFAVGRLLQAKSPKAGGPPGFALFEEAKRRIPPMDVLQKAGIVAVEDLGLTALYLQIIDRKDDAYIYSNMALRLAIRLGLHRMSPKKGFCRSGAVRPNRLWWSIYMQERRLTAAGGYPLSLSDDDITTPSAYDVVGFASATPIYVNAQIARVVGRITSTIYGIGVKTDTAFLAAVQDILTSLHAIEIEMPKEYLVEFTTNGLYIAGRAYHSCSTNLARTASSLHLSIYQALIHTLRPLMLHVVRNRHQGLEGNEAIDPLQSGLIEICVESARKGLLIMSELQKGEIIGIAARKLSNLELIRSAKHAFLDLDTIFSIAFIFILLQAISPSHRIAAVGIARSSSILGYLARFGNEAASNRLHEIEQISSDLFLSRGRNDNTSSSTGVGQNSATLDEPFRFLQPCQDLQTNHEAQRQLQHGTSASVGVNHDGRDALNSGVQSLTRGKISFPGSPLPRNDDPWPLIDASLGDETQLSQIYQNIVLPSAGVDFLDWEALDMGWAPQSSMPGLA